MTRPVFRFAPSPNGPLHLGHAYSALLNRQLADKIGGRLLLRIEDIDPARSRPDHVAAILDDLSWLGLAFEAPVRHQSAHMADYEQAAARLRESGLLFPCFCTRSAIARDAEAGARDPDGAPLYPGTCRHLGPQEIAARIEAGLVPAWRLDGRGALASVGEGTPLTSRRFAADGAETIVPAYPERWGDPILVRRDTPTSYHLAVVVDDALQGVTHVVRGRDLEAATDLHVLLQALLGLPSPRYHHHDLILDDDGRKLAKSAGSRALADLRREGVSAAAIRARLGFGS